MHCPGHPIGWVITATGVTPDIVLANFFIICHKQFSKFGQQTEIHSTAMANPPQPQTAGKGVAKGARGNGGEGGVI
jgi:uncharacterized membrane protein